MKALEAYLPEYEFSERHRVAIAAAPERVDEALRAIYADDLPLLRLLFGYADSAGGRRGARSSRSGSHSRTSQERDSCSA